MRHLVSVDLLQVPEEVFANELHECVFFLEIVHLADALQGRGRNANVKRAECGLEVLEHGFRMLEVHVKCSDRVDPVHSIKFPLLLQLGEYAFGNG